MNVLVISRSPWNNSNSFGNTFTNLFEGMNDITISSISCQGGFPDNNVAVQSLLFSDVSVLKSIIGSDPAILAKKTEYNEDPKIFSSAAKKRNTFFYICRDMIWMLGRWKDSKSLKLFLEDAKPDVIYLPIYASWYMCVVDIYLIQKLSIPVVGHISDDVYGYLPKNLHYLSKNFYRYILRKYIKKVVASCSYLEVFAENMKEEYERIFNKPCYVIGKGVRPVDVRQQKYYSSKCAYNNIVYTGGIGGGRYNTIVKLANALDDCGLNDVIINVYTATQLDNAALMMISEYPSIIIHPPVSQQEVLLIQNNADILLHVEDFSDEAVYSTRMSFSTKIIDYLKTGNVVLAIGPVSVNSIQVLKKYNMAYTVTDTNAIAQNIRYLFDNIEICNLYCTNAQKYLREHRDIKTIQNGIRKRMESLVGVE